MKASIWSGYLKDESPETMLAMVRDAGWRFVELADEHGEELEARGGAESAGRALRRVAADRGVSIEQGHLQLSADIAAVDPGPTIDALKRRMDLYAAVGIRNAVLHPGGKERLSLGSPLQEIHERRIMSLRELCAHVRGSGLRICLENIPGTLAECAELLEAISCVGEPDLGICLDTGHLNLCSGDQVGFVRQAGERLFALHVSDNDGTKDQHVAPYARGTISWPPFVAAVSDIGYDGLFNLEVPGENRCPIAIRLRKLRYMRELVDLMLEVKTDETADR